MSTVIDAICPLCESSMEMPYILLGSSLPCCACGEDAVLEICLGTNYPNTGHELRFSDFQQLLNYRAYRSATTVLLHKWYDYRTVVEDDSPQVQSSDGDCIDIVELHQRIQADPEKQLALYRTAMGLWR